VLPEDGGQTSPLLGKPAPEFTIQRLTGAPFDLRTEKGKVIVLDFWATWCGPCVTALPETLKVLAEFDPAKVTFLAVNQGEPQPVVASFLEKRGWNMPVALDLQQKIGAMYGAESIPHTVIIGQDGQVAWTHTGNAPGDANKLAAAIRKALGLAPMPLAP
jgi:thiol-disulfide isomerase/thioredoxin